MTFGWLKRFVPKSLFGRTLLILLVPIITIQLAVSYVFIQRLYENVTAQMTQSMAKEILLVLDRIEGAGDPSAGLAAGAELAEPLAIALFEGRSLPAGDTRGVFDLSGRVVMRELRATISGIEAIDLRSNDNRVSLGLSAQGQPFVMQFARNRVSASNPHQLLVLMVLVSLIMTLVSFLFLKNQVRPIRRLAHAAEAFGKGRIEPYRPSGATEVRQAGNTFLAMRNRIERHIEQRTLLLSGVSHDLRTPLTRLKLGVSLLEEEGAEALMNDIRDMEGMLDTFLSFSRLDATEERQPVDAVALARNVVAQCTRDGEVTLGTVEGEGMVEISPMTIERALQNLIGNGLRYGTAVRVGVSVAPRSVRFRIEDNGPGIPEEKREAAMKPFARLDPARNQDKGSGVGLGLSIVGDIARQHGGMLRLGDSEDMGGLRADLILAR